MKQIFKHVTDSKSDSYFNPFDYSSIFTNYGLSNYGKFKRYKKQNTKCGKHKKNNSCYENGRCS